MLNLNERKNNKKRNNANKNACVNNSINNQTTSKEPKNFFSYILQRSHTYTPISILLRWRFIKWHQQYQRLTEMSAILQNIHNTRTQQCDKSTSTHSSANNKTLRLHKLYTIDDAMRSTTKRKRTLPCQKKKKQRLTQKEIKTKHPRLWLAFRFKKTIRSVAKCIQLHIVNTECVQT